MKCLIPKQYISDKEIHNTRNEKLSMQKIWSDFSQYVKKIVETQIKWNTGMQLSRNKWSKF